MTQSRSPALNGKRSNRRGHQVRFPFTVVAVWVVLMAVLVVLILAAGTALAKKPAPEPPSVEECESATTLDGVTKLECDWTPTPDGDSGIGTVTATVLEGEIRSVAIFVRDSAPGDICALNQVRNPAGAVIGVSFPLIFDGVTYWDEGTNWCEGFDPIAGQREDLNGEPLHVTVSLRAKKGTVVEISLSPGQAISQRESGN